MPAAALRRLPGVVFEAQPPPSPRVLPRMDVAAFVGFAAAGPLHVPVPVEDAERFADVFGDDAPLAWDGERGEQARAQLAPAVRAFFRNGGRRAWVLRVASEDASRARLPVPGLLEHVPGGAPPSAAKLWARSRGSWADALTVGAALSSTPAVLLSGSLERLAFRIEAGAATIAPGDMLRIRVGRYTVLAVVCAVRRARAPRGGPPRPGRTELIVLAEPDATLWLEETAAPAGALAPATYVDVAGHERSAPAVLDEPESPLADTLTLLIDAPPALAPRAETLVGWHDPAAPRTLWLRADEVGERDGALAVTGAPSWALDAPPSPAPALAPGTGIELLTLELWARRGRDRVVLADLGFAPGHSRYLGDLPTDEQLFTPREAAVEPDPALWAAAAEPRFALAGKPGPVFYPVGVDAVPRAFLGPLHSPGAPLFRDGLDAFGDALFLDDDLRATGLGALAGESDHIRWQSPVPRRLTGIHALLELEEATIVAVPDAAHGRWNPAEVEPLPLAPPSLESPPSPPPAPREFDDCALRELDPTVLYLTPRDQGGSFGLRWEPVDEPGVRYVLEEGTDRGSWAGARTIYSGPDTEIRLYGRTAGIHFYRVRAQAGPNVGPWSNGVTVPEPAGSGYLLEADKDYRADVLLAVQRALLRLCASRGDMLAVLSLPRHYRPDAAINHARRLRSAFDPLPIARAPRDRVLPLGASEARALGFGALYHPWLVLSTPERDEPFRAVAPDGTATGVIARRAATRGAWVAPANEPLADTIALERPAAREALWALQDAQVNELRHEPAGFVCLCEDTLVEDPELRPINVRRLLSLLRRLVLREGTQYVFEPNDPTFRRGVERGFGEIMQILYALGAFAGATPEQAYRVQVGDPPNTPNSVDTGRLIVELALAPSRPLAFLLVRLVHAGDRGFALEMP